jgi:hypothetical protein
VESVRINTTKKLIFSSVNVLWLVILNTPVCTTTDGCGGSLDSTAIGNEAVPWVDVLLPTMLSIRGTDNFTSSAWADLPRDEWYNNFLDVCGPASCTYMQTQDPLDTVMDSIAVLGNTICILG